MNYYEHHLGDYYRKAKHLTMLEHGAYRMLLDLYYIHEMPLPADIKAIQRLAGARMDDEKEAVENVVREFFTLEGDGWRHDKCDEEIEKARVRIEAARENGRRGGRPKKNSDESGKEPKPNQPETQSVKSGSDLETQTKPHHFPTPNSQQDKASIPREDEAFDRYNAMASRIGLPQVQARNDTRRKALRARLDECGGLEGWEVALAKAEASDFLRGKNRDNWQADFDFLIQRKSFTKLMEGSYDNRPCSGKPGGGSRVTAELDALAQSSR